MSLAHDLLAKANLVPVVEVKKVKGVTWHIRDKRWESRIFVKGQRIYLGYFSEYRDAVKARLEGETIYLCKNKR